MNEVISRTSYDKLESLLLSLFLLKVKINTENALLAQDTSAHVRKKEKPIIVVIKIDIEKAYDTVDYKNFIRVLE